MTFKEIEEIAEALKDAKQRISYLRMNLSDKGAKNTAALTAKTVQNIEKALEIIVRSGIDPTINQY